MTTNPEASRQADECKRLAAGVRIAITRQCIDPSGRNVARCDLADGALEAAIDQLASMIPAGGLAEEAPQIRMERAKGDTVREMRLTLSQLLWMQGDVVLCWVNEGDYIRAALSAPTLQPGKDQPR